eukprot:SAG31_NODE_2767_length_5122_cov_7.978101_6_plen_111_part_00
MSCCSRSKAPHGYFAPRLDWSSSFALNGSSQTIEVRILVDRSIVEVFLGGGKIAAVMAYQPPNEVDSINSKKRDLAGYSSVHFFADQPTMANLEIHQMGCGWNQTLPTRV